MNEFINKLIERLNAELPMYASDWREDMNRIVNQLADEYADNEVLNMAQMNVDYQKAKLEELKHIREAVVVGGWIPCSERLPEESHDYLICDDKGNVYSSTYCNNRWLVNFATDEVVAWQPLPQPYQTEECQVSDQWKQQTMNKFEKVE